MNDCNWIPDRLPQVPDVPDCPPNWENDDAREAAAEAQRILFAEEYASTGVINVNGLKLTNADVALAAAESGEGLKEGLEEVLDYAMELALTDLGWS